MNNPMPNRKKQNIIVGSLFVGVVVLIVTLYIGLGQNPKDMTANFIDKPAIAFKASWIQGQEHLGNPTGENFRLQDFRGKNLVLNFWASWCVSCRAEAVALEAFHQQIVGSDTIVVGVAIQDTYEAAKQFADHYGKQYILGLDMDGKASIDYGVTGAPETVFINKEGIVKYKHIGPVDLAMLNEFKKKYF